MHHFGVLEKLYKMGLKYLLSCISIEDIWNLLFIKMKRNQRDKELDMT